MQQIIKVMDLVKECVMCKEHMEQDGQYQWTCDCGISVIENGCPDCDGDTYIDDLNIERCVNCDFEEYTFCEVVR